MVVDEVLGDIGAISDVREMPAQDLLVVTAPGGEVLVPFVEDFIVEFDDAGEGLVYGFAGRTCRSRRFGRIERKGRRVAL